MAKNKDLNLQVRAEALGKTLEGIAESVEAELKQAVSDVAHGAYAKIMAKAQSSLNESFRQDFIKALNFQKLGDDSYLISLDNGWANKIEEGMPSFDMKPGLLGSQKVVSQGKRAGQKWVQQSKDGKKFAAVPMQQKSGSKVADGKDLDSILGELKAYNRSGRSQKFNAIFKDPSGKPLQGKVASVKNTGVKNLDNITKYQRVYKDKKGKNRTESVYMTYRIVSEDSPGWRHPGFEGLNSFEEAEAWVDRELDNILNTLLS